LPVLRERRHAWFVALELAMACIAVGWLVLDEPVGTIANGTALVGFGAAWVWSGRGHR
jgi:hypothetical protein